MTDWHSWGPADWAVVVFCAACAAKIAFVLLALVLELLGMVFGVIIGGAYSLGKSAPNQSEARDPCP